MDDSQILRKKLTPSNSCEQSETKSGSSAIKSEPEKSLVVLRRAPESPKLRDDVRKFLAEAGQSPTNVTSRGLISPTPMLSSASSICNRRRIPTPLSFVESLSPVGSGSFSPFLSTPVESISPTVLLSPVLSRPVRSLSASGSASSPFLRNPPVSDSESELLQWTHGGSIYRNRQHSRTSRPSDSSSPLATPPITCGSPTLALHSNSPTKLLRSGGSGSFHGHHRQQESFDSGSSYLTPNRNSIHSIQRSNSECVEPIERPHSSFHEPRSLLTDHHLNRIRRMRRRPSAATTSLRSGIDAFLQNSIDSPNVSPSNLVRLRMFPLGHSDPQIYASTSSSSIGGSRMSVASSGRRSCLLTPNPFLTKVKKDGTLLSPRLSPRRPEQTRTSPSPSASTAGSSGLGPSGSIPCKSPVRLRMRSTASTTGSGNHNGGSGRGVPLRQPGNGRAGSSLAAPIHHAENRRWSLASLPSSSGYGTPGSNSAFSSQYSSQEHLADIMGEMRQNPRFDSNDSYPSYEDVPYRPRSRSLTSPVRFTSESGAEVPIMSTIYKERFPKAKAQLEYKLQQFLLENAPLSGFTTSVALDLTPRPISPSPTQQTIAQPQRQSSPQPPSHLQTAPRRPSSPHRPASPLMRPISPLAIESHLQTAPRRPSSPHRPASPLMRPISPLAIESATATPDGVVFRTSHHSQALDANTSSTYLVSPGSSSVFGGSFNTSMMVPSRSNRCSIVGALEAIVDPQLLRLIAEGATRFLHHQICEVAADCLQKSRDDLITCAYFCDMSTRLEETLAEAEGKTGPESYKYLSKVAKQLLMIVSRAARLLECLEFNPGEFYQLLEEAEGAVRVQLGSGTARVPDLPQYIINKLGLNKALLMEQADDGEITPDENEKPTDENIDAMVSGKFSKKHEDLAKLAAETIFSEVPKEEDFDTIRLISNGAYGAVYLVRHKKTRQRFALKKMKKTTLLLRNQVDQVFAERDILTFTDNPFVVCFYGSFETKAHLCMLMEYVEGGDCAALLKSAGTLPIELARLYVAETVLAIEYLHSCGIVHRDLKPDNLLITAMGHIKLTDFGLSKIGLMNRTTLVSEGYLDDTHQFKDNQLCGTPEYIAPEVILRQGYGKPVDWWALGIILYEFLIGIVAFMGDSPEELFANIINEEVDYPTGDEALPPEAENLIRLLLEKNPVDRLGTIDGAAEVQAHAFFATLDFDSLLRQKAEFVPQLENEEDTSYFDSRVDRYNHDADSGDDENIPMFWSFSTASPRHSIVGLELPPGGLAQLASIAASSSNPPSSLDMLRKCTSNAHSSDDGGTGTPSTGTGSGSHSAFSAVGALKNSRHSDSTDSQFGDLRLPPSSGSIGNRSLEGEPLPSAVLLRRRFSAQRHTNLSTSSSGTTGTGGGINTACSSTDSSMDASNFHLPNISDSAVAAASLARRNNANLTSPLPRFAISPCERSSPVQRRTKNSDEEHERPNERAYSFTGELSPVQERSMQDRTPTAEEEMQSAEAASPTPIMHRASPTKPDSLRSSQRGGRIETLQVLIPSSASPNAGSSAGSSPSAPGSHSNQASSGHTYYHSGQLSPGGNSISSISSFDSNSPNPSSLTVHDQVTLVRSPHSSPVPTSSTSLQNQKPPIVIRKGQQGYGFTIRSVRVYLSESSEYYTIEHIVSAVRENSPAYEAGLRENDLITHIHTQAVHNMTHPQLMHRLLSCGNEITLHVTPLQNTSIKEGEARRTVGKLLRKKPRKPQRRIPLDKKPRKGSSLLRRLSGKRGAGDIVPGTSSQKQTFMPRSVSSQDGVSSKTLEVPDTESGNNLSPHSPLSSTAPPRHKISGASSSSAHKRLSDFGLGSNLPETSHLRTISSSIAQPTSPLAQEPPPAVSKKSITKPPSEEKVKAPSLRRGSAIQPGETQHSPPRTPPPQPQRPSTFQGLKNKVAQRLAPYASAATASASSFFMAATGNGETATSTQQPIQPIQTDAQRRKGSAQMPLSPLARQSSNGESHTEGGSKATVTVTTSTSSSKSVNRSPSPGPSRKLSPSRIMQRFWRSASGGNGNHSTDVLGGDEEKP
uniref:non-specific serine/threonine protein kinase n=1 Tax=Acrobeloides nanus TaxID=290746 RepID=A0A914CC86_9BILA